MLDEDFDLAGCLAQVREQNQAAARSLVEHLYPMVIRIVRSHLPRRVLEEDLAQDIFLKMFSRFQQYKGVVPFTHWVSRIAVTTCIDQLRAQKRRPELRWSDLGETEVAVLEATMEDKSQDSLVDSIAAKELVHKMLDTLPPKDRALMILIDLEGRSLKEASEMTGWSENLIKVRAFRARKKLQKAFKQLQQEEKND